MAPATTKPARAAQVAQLMDVLKGLTSVEFQRLLENGDLLLLIAKKPASEESARMLRHYANGYMPLLSHYHVGSWAQLRVYIGQVRSWAIKLSDGSFHSVLEYYRLTDADRETVLNVIRGHWMDYPAWYIRVA